MDCGGIPSGLNRIKTSRERPPEWSSSGGDDSPAASSGGDGPVAPSGGGAQRVDKGEGFRKGKKLSRWFSSYLINRGSSKSSNILPSTSKVNEKRSDFIRHGEKECLENNDARKKLDRRNSMKERTYIKKTKKGQKSFSHELGPRGGIPLEQPRARSYNDLEELLKSLHSMYNDAKEEVDAELALLLVDILDVLEKDTYMESRETITDLLVLARQCREMPPLEFRDKCGGIVQDLADRWKQCPEGWLKQVFTHLLFILTRCTRLLQLQNDGKTISEDSIHKFKQCLAGVPMVEMGSVRNLRHADFGFPNAPKPYDAPQCKFEMGNKISTDSSDNHVIDSGVGISASPKSHKHMPLYPKEVISLHDQICNSFPKTLQDQQMTPLNNYEELLPASDFVMCRICEENIPTNHLESHSYICAYADKCDLEGITVDDRLLKVADILEQIVESYKQKFHLTSSPDIPGNDKAVCDTRSPKVLEWHTKGAEGMFEDLHEMDTAFIDESQSACFSSLKAHLVTKFGISDVASNGSMTPVSSESTPKTNYFDLFWLEYNNPSEQEDSKLMGNLADATRKIAKLDLSNEHSPENLRDHMDDLQHIMRKSNHRALVIDTFGNRIINLLREKYLLAIKFAVPKRSVETQLEADTKRKSCDECTESTTTSLNTDLSYKERIGIDDFEIIKPISRGAFGKVFLARKRTTGDLFAIKVLKKVNMLRKNDIERILSERNILITARNPFVVRFFYSFTCRDSLYLVMEYLNGGDLYSLLRKVGCLEEDVARIYIAELVLSLEYLHSLGIVHRDLKPDNILIAKDGHIKLTDFGLSKIGLLNHAADLSGSRTSTNDLKKKKRDRRTAMGTPDYLAPEILLGTEHGYAADWWSVGIILFEFTTGIPPFAACLPKEIFDNILNRRIPWPDVPKDMSYDAKDLIDRLLVQDPNMRLGVNGASEVKNHPFFQKIDWDNFSSQQAAFVPNPDSADDTSYFLSRYDPHLTNLSDNQDPCGIELSDDQDPCGYVSDAIDSSSNPDLEMYECGHSKNVDDSDSLDLSRIKFSFKNLSQLASMNHDVLIQSGKASNRSSPVTRPSTPS